MTKRFGFTLAEVLITLGIIGVVAAMTMPTLINQTNGAQYKAAYKKALSAISQGITLNVALDDKSFADAGQASTKDDTAATDSFMGYLKARMNVVNVVASTPYNTTNGATLTDATGDTEKIQTGSAAGQKAADLWVFFNDGSMFAFDKSGVACTETNKCKGYIDVNGIKGPNKVVKCDVALTDTNTTCSKATPTDIYPVDFYDQTILPNTPAGKAVLYGK